MPLALAALTPMAAKAATLNDVTNIVVIYAENRSFDSLYGNFPGANGVANAPPRRRSSTATARR